MPQVQSYGNARLHKVETRITWSLHSNQAAKSWVSSGSCDGRVRGRDLRWLTHQVQSQPPHPGTASSRHGLCQTRPRTALPEPAKQNMVNHSKALPRDRAGTQTGPPSPGILGPPPASNYIIMKQKPRPSSRPKTEMRNQEQRMGGGEGANCFSQQRMPK